MKRIALVLLSTVLLSVNTSAWALFGDDEARKAILELRDQLKSQQEVQMSLYDRLEKLTKEVQTLRGKVEDLTNSVGKEKQNAEHTAVNRGVVGSSPTRGVKKSCLSARFFL